MKRSSAPKDKSTPKKKPTLKEREQALLDESEKLRARAAELDEREARLASLAPPSIPAPAAAPLQPPPPPPSAAALNVFEKLTARMLLARRYDTQMGTERKKELLRENGRSYAHVQDGRLLSFMAGEQLYNNAIERFFVLFLPAPRVKDVVRVAQFLEQFTKKLMEKDADNLLNAFYVRVNNAERMRTVLAWLEDNPADEYLEDNAEEFATRVSDLLYERFADSLDYGGPPQAKELKEVLPEPADLTLTDPIARRNAALDEKIRFFREFESHSSSSKQQFLLQAHRHHRDVKAGAVLSMVKEAFPEFYSCCPPDFMMSEVIWLARCLTLYLNKKGLEKVACVVTDHQSMKILADLFATRPPPTKEAVRECIVDLTALYWRKQVLALMNSVLPGDTRTHLKAFEESLNAFVKILELLCCDNLDDDDRSKMRSYVETLREQLLEVQKGVAAEIRSARRMVSYDPDEATPPQPLNERARAWITAQGYFQELKKDLIAAGVPQSLYKEVRDMKFTFV